MAAVNKTSSRKRRSGSMRQSVSIPAPLAAEVRRVAKERHLTISRTLVTLAERGVRAEQEAQDNLKIAYRRFLQKQEPDKKEQAGKDLLRAIFGKAGIAEETLL
jgi:predicted DNA-binding ribbon-helix-helix protein